MTSAPPAGRGRHRVPGIAVILAVALLLVVAQPLHAWLLSVLESAEAPLRERSAWGMAVFVMLVALSAMVAFVSSAVFVPLAISVWGATACAALLWVGWFVGGLAAYGIGRFVGRPAVGLLVREETLARYEGWVRSGKSLVLMLTFLLAIPSDLACYLFGLVRCRFIPFVAALAVAEVPYAVGAVYLGTSFLERRILPLVLLGIAGLLLSAWALRRLHDHHVPTSQLPADLHRT